jgi:hypothetical protein
MTKQTDLEKLNNDVEALRALRARLIKQHGEKQTKRAVYSIDRKIEETIEIIAKIEMKTLQANTVQTW